ncbi:MAG TPA: hypothetical protein ENN99_00805 [Chloroflexi bacterium]|nr:hypothetical protein [Chloroflexota bacterium]
MKMIMAVVPRSESDNVLHALVSAGHTATFTESRGGMLRQAQMTLFIAVQAQDLEKVLDIIKNTCYSCVTVESTKAKQRSDLAPESSTSEIGGAVVFVWDMDRLETYR